MAHAVRVPVATEANNNEALFFAHDGLVDMPCRDKMRKDDGTHDDEEVVNDLVLASNVSLDMRGCKNYRRKRKISFNVVGWC